MRSWFRFNGLHKSTIGFFIMSIIVLVTMLATSCSSGNSSSTTSTTSTSTSAKPAQTTSTAVSTSSAPTSTATQTSSAPSSTAPQTSTSAARPAPSGSLRIAMPGFEDETFLPWNGAAGRKFYVDTIYEYLIYLDPVTREPKPGLATSWQMTPDGKTWTVNLRQGVQFQENNGEFTSADVKFTFEKIMDPSSKASQASTFRSSIDSIVAKDKYTVVFNLKVPDYFLWSKFSNMISNFIVCKAYVEKAGDAAADAKPIGTGAYALADRQRGVSIKVAVVPGVENHWRVKPDYKDITFKNVPEESTRVAMLKAGETDMAPISMDSVDSVKASKFNIMSIKDMWAPRIVFGGMVQTDPNRYNAAAPWAKKEVRQALNYAVDKESIARNIFHGQASANFHPFYFTNQPAIYPYDAAKAKQLLAAAGYPNGFQVNLYTCPRSPGAQLPDIGLAVATYWEAAGIKVKVTPTDYPTIRTAWNAGKANDMFWTHIASPPLGKDDSGTITAGYTDKSVFATFTSKELDALGASALNEGDVAKRTAIMANFYNYLTDQADYLYLTTVNEPYAAISSIGTWPTVFNYPSNFDQITKAK
jgi:peptide/nickel transport system substrate-binding protein